MNDVERLRQMYDLFEAEANACLAKGLVLPAHDYILKCSHTFNVLDTRGAVGVTERQALFGRMREVSRRVAEAYLEQRQHLEYPFIKETGRERPAFEKDTAPVQQVSASVQTSPGNGPQPFLCEIGVEELPVGDLQTALGHLRGRLPALLDELRLEHGEVQVSGTLRRLVVPPA